MEFGFPEKCTGMERWLAEFPSLPADVPFGPSARIGLPPSMLFGTLNPPFGTWMRSIVEARG